MRAGPQVESIAGLVVVSGPRPTDMVLRSPDGATLAVVVRGEAGDERERGAWIVDLDEARVVTFVPAPWGVRSAALTDAETLCALGDDEVLRVYLLPDGGLAASVAAPGARWIDAATPGQTLLCSGGWLSLAPDREGFEPLTGESIAWRVDLRGGAVRAVLDEGALAAMLTADGAELRRLASGAELTPWLTPSPDGEELAVVCGVSDRAPRPWRPGDLDEAAWTHAYTFHPDDPVGTACRWAAPIEAWSLSWHDRDTLSGVVGVATGPPPYRALPFAPRRMRRDGAVVTWRLEDTGLLEERGAAARPYELDDGRFCAVVHGPRFARAWTHHPATLAGGSSDLLAGLVSPSVLHPERGVLAAPAPGGGFVLALPLASGETRLVVAGQTIALLPASPGPPHQLRLDRAWIELEWYPPPGAPWRRGYLRLPLGAPRGALTPGG
ncbi:MAG: hypothetical protein Q8S73_25090 [Deltaproteobacteria bacterium]|nr:hypothetical protein [Myxococcales bacterium]MDP3217411.1 hypothetical protein [Deltaproteobacteria bacterium]